MRINDGIKRGRDGMCEVVGQAGLYYGMAERECGATFRAQGGRRLGGNWEVVLGRRPNGGRKCETACLALSLYRIVIQVLKSRTGR